MCSAIKAHFLKPLNLIGLNNGVSLGNGLTAGSLVVIRAVVFVRVPVEGAEHVTAAALETSQSNTLPAGKTPVCLPLGLLGFLRKDHAAGRPGTVVGLVSRQNLRNGKIRPLDRNLLKLFLHSEGIRGIQDNEFIVTFGTEIHCRRASKEAAVVDAKNEAFGDLAAGLFLVPFPALLGHLNRYRVRIQEQKTKLCR